MTWNKKMMHFVRDGIEPIDTKLYFLLEGDFELVEAEQETEVEGQVAAPPDEDEGGADEAEEDAQQILYDVIMNGPDCRVKVWLPNTIGKGFLTPAALFFDENDIYIAQDFNCAQPNVEDGQPQQRRCEGSGLRFLEPFALDVDALNDRRGDAHNFKLKFHNIPYFRGITVPIQKGTDATTPDRLPMFIGPEDDRREVRRILFTVDEEEDEPEPQRERIDSYQNITRGYTTRTEQRRPRQQHLHTG